MWGGGCHHACYANQDLFFKIFLIRQPFLRPCILLAFCQKQDQSWKRFKMLHTEFASQTWTNLSNCISFSSLEYVFELHSQPQIKIISLNRYICPYLFRMNDKKLLVGTDVRRRRLDQPLYTTTAQHGDYSCGATSTVYVGQGLGTVLVM